MITIELLQGIMYTKVTVFMVYYSFSSRHCNYEERIDTRTRHVSAECIEMEKIEYPPEA